ncbi:hypothetical protein FJ366_00870 [Candidatus Dependentiae bacterium]|nr:hypothetical protein [Candidatus Dependentiae bacterium]
MDTWHATALDAQQKTVALFINQVSEFCLISEISGKISLENAVSLFINALNEQLKENSAINQYHHTFDHKIKHGVTFTKGSESEVHWIVSAIEKLLMENPELAKDTARLSHKINNSEFPELKFHTPTQKLSLTLVSLPHDENKKGPSKMGLHF